MNKPWLMHPFLFAMFHILFLFSHNIQELSYFDIVLPAVLAIGFVLLLMVMPQIVFKNYEKSAVLASFGVVLFFSYGHLYSYILDVSGGFETNLHKFLFPACIFFFIIVGFVLVRVRWDFKKITSILNVVALFLVASSLFTIGTAEYNKANLLKKGGAVAKHRKHAPSDKREKTAKPDIYYIVLDGYTASRTLDEVFSMDNSKFSSSLQKKGFYIASGSRSNYAMTGLSLASSLNFKKLNYLTDDLGVESDNPTLQFQMIENSEAVAYLKNQGYKYVHFDSGWGPTRHNKKADLNISTGSGNEFYTLLFHTTMLAPFDGLLGDDVRNRILNTFDKLNQIHEIDAPKFVFAHILCPHPPYVFGAKGEVVPGVKVVMDGYIWRPKSYYVNQVKFVNMKISNIVDNILRKSATPPIIILQGDHGSAASFPDPEIYGWENPTDSMLKERMSIFNAYYLPSGGSKLLYNTITPMNSFRLIFDFYFGENYGLLPDRSFYSPYSRPYDFTDVTDAIRDH